MSSRMLPASMTVPVVPSFELQSVECRAISSASTLSKLMPDFVPKVRMKRLS